MIGSPEKLHSKAELTTVPKIVHFHWHQHLVFDIQCFNFLLFGKLLVIPIFLYVSWKLAALSSEDFLRQAFLIYQCCSAITQITSRNSDELLKVQNIKHRKRLRKFENERGEESYALMFEISQSEALRPASHFRHFSSETLATKLIAG